MSEKLGFTFYPKDWWTSDTFYELSPVERYLYLELLFLMYVNSGAVTNDKASIERRLSCTISDSVWLKVVNLMVIEGNNLTHKSVNKRLSKTLANRENGKKGGRPKNDEKKPKNDLGFENGKSETTENQGEKTQKTQIENPNETQTKGKEKEKEKEKRKLGAGNLPTPKNDFVIREQQFYNSLAKYVETYGKEMVRKFYDYWREPNKSKSKMRWEQERTWDLGLRLKKWETNDFKFNGGKQNYQPVAEPSKMVM